MTGCIYNMSSMLKRNLSLKIRGDCTVLNFMQIIARSELDSSRLWYQHEDNSFSTKKVYKGHPKYVSCVAFQEPSDEFPSGLIYTGCQDGKVRAFLPDIEDPLFQMEGHAENVTSLYVGK